MSSFEVKKEIKVFLKCLVCGTFITLPSFSVIKKHFDKCQRQHNKHLINLPVAKVPEETEDELFDMECDFIDDEMESVTFSQPFVLLHRYNLKRSSPNDADNQGQGKSSLHFVNKNRQKPSVGYQQRKKRQRRSVPVPSCSNESLSNVASKLTPRKSRLKALEKLSKARELENDEDCDTSDDEDWESESDEAPDNNELQPGKNVSSKTSTKTALRPYSLKLCCAYDNPNFPFKCDKCTTRFTTENRLTWHKKKVHESENKNILSCSICGRMFHNRCYFQSHLQLHENAEDIERELNLWTKWPKAQKAKNNKSKKQVYNCKHCLMPLASHHKFVTHMTTHSEKDEHVTFQCPYTCATQTESIKELIVHIKTDHSEMYLGKAVTYEDGKPKQKCDECGKLFDGYYMSTHKASHSHKRQRQSDGIYSCPYPNCQVTCKEVGYFKNHFTLHLQNNPYICIFPGCEVKGDHAARLKRHIKLHLDTPLTCLKCGVTYCSDNINRHSCQANIQKQESGQCKLVKIGQSWRLKPSRRAKSYGERCSNNSVIKEGTREEYLKYIKMIQKIDRSAVMRSDPVFIQACKDNPGFGELLLGANSFECNFGAAKNKTKVRSFKCSRCPTVIAGRQGFMEHQKHCDGTAPNSSSENKHSKLSPVGETSLQIGCPVCGKSFPGLELLGEHFSDEHGPYKSLQCEEPDCGLYFANAASKRRHILQVHAHRPFPCSKCDKRFVNEVKLNVHLKLHLVNPHLGVLKPAPCDLCGIVLVNIYSRKRHMHLVHGVTLPPPGKPGRTNTNMIQKIERKRRRPVKKVPQSQSQGGNPNQTLIKIKIEPELHILPVKMEDEESDDNQEFPQGDVQIGMKQEFGS